MARVNGYLVSEEYCGICRTDGDCQHKQGLEILLQEQDHEEEQAHDYAVAVGVG